MVSQLALAYEKQLITDGCSLHLTVDNASSDQELTKTENSSSSDSRNPPAIKLQVVTRGKTTDLELDGVATNLFWSVGLVNLAEKQVGYVNFLSGLNVNSDS